MAVRVGDREREAAVARLSEHAAAGRLTVAELEERVERAQNAVYADDLRALEADLPAPRRPPARRPVPAAPLVALVAGIALSAAIGHPVVPLFILAALLFRAHVTRAGVASTLR
jgi:ferric-dicitrate binding protein FerR (iron transport regulator)